MFEFMNNDSLYVKSSVLFFFLFLPSLFVNGAPPEPLKLSDFDPNAVSKSAIAFLNLSSMPGIDGGTISINDGNARQSEITHGSLGFTADFNLNNTWIDGYWGGALSAATIDDSFLIFDDEDNSTTLALSRSVMSLQGSGGLSFPINKHLKIRTFASVIFSRFDNYSLAVFPPIPLSKPSPTYESSSTTEALTGVGHVAFNYQYWLQESSLEFDLQYSASITETFDQENDLLNAEDNVQTIVFKGLWSIPTNMHTKGLPWHWNVFYKHTHFLSQEREALGFTYFHEIGMGLDYEWNIKVMNWFGVRYVGIRSSVLFGDNVEGFNAEFYFR